MAHFFDGEENLFPTDRGVTGALGKFGSRPWLLKQEPPDAEDDPVCKISQRMRLDLIRRWLTGVGQT